MGESLHAKASGAKDVVARLASATISALAQVHRLKRAARRRTLRHRRLEAERQSFYGDVWAEAAEAAVLPVRRLTRGILVIESSRSRLLVQGNKTSLDDPVTLSIAGDKPLVHEQLSAQGLPVPRHAVHAAGDIAGAWRSLQQLGGRAVVKPARSTGSGDGVVIVDGGRLELVLALGLAGAYCDEVLLEEVVRGDNYRLLYFDAELIDVVRRDPPALHGDGRSTLAELIAAENEQRSRGGIAVSHALLRVDGEVRATLAEQAFTLRSVPTAGRVVRLKRIASDNRSDENRLARGFLCDEVVAAGSRATQALGVRLAAVDLITPDGRLPLEQAGGAIIEVNTTPGLTFHYGAASRSNPVAAAVLDRVFPRA